MANYTVDLENAPSGHEVPALFRALGDWVARILVLATCILGCGAEAREPEVAVPPPTAAAVADPPRSAQPAKPPVDRIDVEGLPEPCKEYFRALEQCARRHPGSFMPMQEAADRMRKTHAAGGPGARAQMDACEAGAKSLTENPGCR
jgi:hypothetical protein